MCVCVCGGGGGGGGGVCNGNWPQIFALSLQRSARPQPPLLRQPNEIEGGD